jgi:nitrite reductase/ring-hydroxylating ferredoxin subunit
MHGRMDDFAGWRLQSSQMPFVTLCELPELLPDQGKYVEIDGFRLAVFLHEGGVYVMDNYCPHAGGNLAGGYVEEGCAVCPRHHWAFGLDDGQLRGAAGVMVRTYPTRVQSHEGRQLVQADLPIY